eukprot:6424713-Prorocentrum_lima.AAC.1
MAENLADRLHVENSLWENISEAGVRECSRTGGLCSKWKESCRKSKNVQSQGVYLRAGGKTAGYTWQGPSGSSGHGDMGQRPRLGGKG